MKKWNLVIFLIYVTLWKRVHSYPRGAPTGVCGTMVPHHHGALVQSSKSPFQVEAKNTGSSITVTIRDPDKGTKFRGFMLRSFQSNGNEVSGEFSDHGNFSKTIECGQNENDTLTHNSRDDKSSITATWQPLSNLNAPMFFKATVVLEVATFWTEIKSNEISVDGLGIGSKNEVTSALPNADIYSGCGSSKGCFGLPGDCLKKQSCEILLTFVNNANAAEIQFEMIGALGSRGGWIAMGLSRDDKMGDDSVTECAYFSDYIRVRESWNFANSKEKGNFLLPKPYNITDERGEYENGVITCSWNRPLYTIANGMVFDLSTEKFHLLLARGPINSRGEKDIHTIVAKSEYLIDLKSVSIVVGKKPTLMKIHGAFMTAAWIGFVSIGILIARHYKEVWSKYKLCGVKVWFAIHRCFMIISIGLIAVAFIVIFVDVGGWSQMAPNPHAIIGCIATAFAILQPFIAAARPAPDHPKRPIFRWVHGLVGNGGQLLAVINMFFAVGLRNSNLPQAFNWVLVTFVIFHCLVHLLIHIHSCLMERERDRDGNTKTHHLQFADSYNVNDDGAGSAFKRFALGLHSMVTVGLTVALILMICLN